MLALDVDGVLIEPYPHEQWAAELLENLGIDSVLFFTHLRPHLKDLMTGHLVMEAVLPDVFSRLGADITPQTYLDFWYSRELCVRKDMIDAAKKWQQQTGGRLVLATNQDRSRAKHIWEDAGLNEHFELMLVSCDLGAAKPEPEFFALAAERLGGHAGVLFLDDSLKNVEAALRHGWEARQVEDISASVSWLETLGAATLED